MKISFFSTQPYDRQFFDEVNESFGFELEYLELPLNIRTSALASESEAVCIFVNDKVDKEVIEELSKGRTKIIALRCAGFNNVDIEAARQHNIQICRVPAYSPQAVAEHAMAMILTLNRKTHKAYNRVREQNFSLNGLLGFNLNKKNIGVVGTGNIGKAFCALLSGFGCRVIAYDVIHSPGFEYVTLKQLMQESDIISLHCPLNEDTRHLICEESLQWIKPGTMLINTSRGGLVCTADVIDSLKTGRIGYLGIDVYEQEENLFFRDLSGDIIKDDQIQRLMSFPNVLVTAHQAFFTKEALSQIALTTIHNIGSLLRSEKISIQGALLT